MQAAEHVTQHVVSTPQQVTEVTLSWLRSPELSELASQTARWGEVQWEAARWALQVHGIAPLLYRRMRQSSTLHRLPAALQSYLENQYRLNGQRVTGMTAELVALLHAATQAGIHAVPLKGSVLISHYYEEPGLRPLADLDLLVRSEDESKLTQILLAQGYQMIRKTPRHRAYVPSQRSRQVVYAQGDHPDNPYHIDVHTEVRERVWGICYEMTQQVWDHSRSALFGDAPGLLMAPVELMQHLLIHASADVMVGRVRLVQLYDIALVGARMSHAEWAALLDAGRRRGEERLLYPALSLAERYVGCIASPEVLAALAQGTPARLRAFLEHADLYYLSFCNPQTMSLGEKLSVYRPGREQLFALRYRLFPSPSEMQDLYPGLAQPHLLPVAYLVHLLRILAWPVRQAMRLPRLSWLRRDRGGRW